MIGVEVKAGSVVGDSDFTTLRWFRKKLVQSKFTGIVLHSGSDVARFGEGMFAVPCGMLSL